MFHLDKYQYLMSGNLEIEGGTDALSLFNDLTLSNFPENAELLNTETQI